MRRYKLLALLACMHGGYTVGNVSSEPGSVEYVRSTNKILSLPTDQVSSTLLVGKRFELTVMKGEPFVLANTSALPFLQFTEGLRFNGRACNLFFGEGWLEDGQLLSEHVAMTQMLCAEPPLNQLDRAIEIALQRGMSIGIRDSQLILYNEAEGLVFEHRN